MEVRLIYQKSVVPFLQEHVTIFLSVSRMIFHKAKTFLRCSSTLQYNVYVHIHMHIAHYEHNQSSGSMQAQTTANRGRADDHVIN